MSDAKTEEPTPRREEKARREGRAWQSRDLTLGATLTTFGALIRLGSDEVSTRSTVLFARSLSAAASGDVAPARAIEDALEQGAAIVLPCLVAVLLVGASVSALQLRGLLAFGVLAPDGTRLDPSARFGSDGARIGSTLFTNLARLALVGSVSIATLSWAMPGVATLSRQSPSASLTAAWTITSALALYVGLALIAFGVIDAIVERALFRRSLRMSRREIERERRDAEGDAHLKRERERARSELSRSMTLDDVSSATLVVIDDGVAIGLSYDETDLDAVPRIALSGRGADAGEIVREARASGVRCVSDADLALALAIVPVGADVPEALYDRVASAMIRGAV